MWTGRAEIADCWARYVGATDQNSPHSHVAVQLAAGLGEDVSVRLGEERIVGRTLLIRPLALHQMAPGVADVCFFYIEPQAPLGRALLERLGDAKAIEVEEIGGAIRQRESSHAIDAISELLGVEARQPPNPRLAQALAWLEAAEGAPGSIARAAAEVGLSASRLRVLARRELGVSLARFMLWRKLERALRAVAAGTTLADASAAGGFSDQAHLARTMRSMFGITLGEAAQTLR